MIGILIGYAAGAASAVVFPAVARFASNRIADLKAWFAR
jgi:hypothetical protein